MVLLWTCGYVFLKESSSCFNKRSKYLVISFWLIYWWRRFQGVGSWVLVGGAFGTLVSQPVVSLETERRFLNHLNLESWKTNKSSQALRWAYGISFTDTDRWYGTYTHQL